MSVSDNEGSTTAELAVVFLAIALVLVSCFTISDAFKSCRNAQNVTFTISDIISRYTEFDDAQLDDLNNIFNEVLQTSDSNTYIRVTSVSEYFDTIRIDCSTATNGAETYATNADLPTKDVPIL